MRSSRREFLKAASVAPAVALPQTAVLPRVSTVRDSSFDPGSRPEDLALSCGSSVYDLTMHLHADLPKRVTQP